MAATAEARNNNRLLTKRRRKKRRTADISDSSDSSSSDSLSSEDEKSENLSAEKESDVQPNSETKPQDINIDDIDVESDEESLEALKDTKPDQLSTDTQAKLFKLNLTSTALNKQGSKIDQEKVKEQLNKDRASLNNEYLALMANQYDEELDELRKKPDFTNKSLVILAKTLQAGSNIFSEESLTTILRK